MFTSLSNQIKSFIMHAVIRRSITSFQAEAIYASLRPGNLAPFEKTLQQWLAVGNIVSNLTCSRLEPQTSRSRDERVTVRTTGWYKFTANYT